MRSVLLVIRWFLVVTFFLVTGYFLLVTRCLKLFSFTYRYSQRVNSVVKSFLKRRKLLWNTLSEIILA